MPDAFISIHHNAYAGKWGTHSGVEAFYNLNRKKEIEKVLAHEMSAGIAANTGLKNRGAKHATFRMLTVDHKIIAVLTEGGFMDSTIDHPVITSTKGQEGYAKAISDALIKHLKLIKKVVKPAPNPIPTPPSIERNPSTTTVKIGDKYTLKNNTPGYYTSTDAKAGRNARVSVLAGEFWVYNIANSMINITKSKGKPGSWIDPNVSIGPTTSNSTPVPQKAIVGGTYTLKKNTPGFYTAADAKVGRDQRVTVLAGEYIVFNISNGMLNVTKVKGKPGSWINPQ
jgi:hypothetical protein